MQCLHENRFTCILHFRKGNLPPPNDEDQPAPKALIRLLKYTEQVEKRRKGGTPSNFKPTVNIHKNTSTRRQKLKNDEKSVTTQDPIGNHSKTLSQDHNKVATTSHKANPPMFIKRPGESTRDFLERIDIESKVKIVQCLRKEKEKSDKRKKLVI